MDIPSSKKIEVGTCIRDEKPSLVRVACALRGMLDNVIQGVGESPGVRNLLESAAQNIFIEGVSSQQLGLERKVVKTTESIATTCPHSCAHHAELMDIALWSGLPEELQELVFARLPWPQIYRVRILSKGWNQKLMSGAKGSELKQACLIAQPKLFALLARRARPGLFKVNMFDTASNGWHMFEFSLPGYDPKWGEIEVTSAGDGGLVCFFLKSQSRSKKTPRLVFVCNPLTGVWKRLPRLYGIVQQKIMVQLIMDEETKHYRVIVVGYSKDPKVGNLVNVYHSETGKWTKADVDSSNGEVVYGYLHKSKSDGSRPAPCSYNFADGKLHEILTDFPGNYARNSVLVKDHLFRLLDEAQRPGLEKHYIEEYQAVDCGASWTRLKEYPFNLLPRTLQLVQPNYLSSFMRFCACKDFLLLYVSKELAEDDCLFIYEFSGEEWRALPMMPGGNHSFLDQQQMCELRLDSVP